MNLLKFLKINGQMHVVQLHVDKKRQAVEKILALLKSWDEFESGATPEQTTKFNKLDPSRLTDQQVHKLYNSMKQDFPTELLKSGK